MKPLGLSAYAVAKACHVPRTRIERIAREEIGISADTALRLGKFFSTSVQLWLGLQNDFDLDIARIAISRQVDQIAPLEQAAA